MSAPDLIVSSSRVLTPTGMREAAILVRHGRVSELMAPTLAPAGCPVADLGDLVVMAGLVDSHVHINEPGRTEWEGFDTATRAAAAGGITTLVDMPLNSNPVTTSVKALYEKINAAKNHCWVDCGFYGGVVPGNAGELPGLIDLGVMGFKAFLTHSGIDDFPNVTKEDLRAALPILAEAGVPLLVHAELDRHKATGGGPADAYSTYLASRPREWEHEAIRLLINLCREFDARIHIVHLSSADALPMIAKAREEGLPLTVETCPHYLCFTAEEIPTGATEFKCAPPIREAENRERLWAGLAEGLIDFIVADHSPCPPELKLQQTGDFTAAWGGIAGLQLGLPAVWTEARRRGHGIEDLARWMGRQPARFVSLGSRKGVIGEGHDADLVAWDPEATFTVEAAMLAQRHKHTPYSGRELQGVVQQTWLRGMLVYDRGSFPGEPAGKLLLQDSEQSSAAPVTELSEPWKISSN